MSRSFRPAEVAERWRMSKGKVLKLIHSGEFRAIKFGPKAFRVSLDAIEECEKCKSLTWDRVRTRRHEPPSGPHYHA
jgi:excisionase family DNA binding protein